MIIDISSKPLIDQLLAASEIEGVAIKALLSALQNGVRDSATLEDLTNQMTGHTTRKWTYGISWNKSD